MTPNDELAAALTVGAEPPQDVDVQLLAWAVSNCHTLARRELNRLRPYVVPDTLAIERWEHVLRICEKAGARSKGVLRASLPTEITDGGSDGNEQAWADLRADGGLPESHAVGAERVPSQIDRIEIAVRDGHYSLLRLAMARNSETGRRILLEELTQLVRELEAAGVPSQPQHCQGCGGRALCSGLAAGVPSHRHKNGDVDES